jgi:hypothetical protein
MSPSQLLDRPQTLQRSHKHDDGGGKGRAAVTGDGKEFKKTVSSTSDLLLNLEEYMDI